MDSAAGVTINDHVFGALETTLFYYFRNLREFVNVLATSKRNFLKDILLSHFKNLKHLNLEYQIIGSKKLFYYLQFCEALKCITMNQYQRKNDELAAEHSQDLIEFLDKLHHKYPNMCQQLQIIRVSTLQYDQYENAYFHKGYFPDIQKYPIDRKTPRYNSSTKKYPNLRCFISFGNWNNMIYPEHVEYISKESNDLNVVEIENMAPSNQKNESFKQLFNQHKHLKVLRVRNSQNFECAQIPTISPSDFKDASLECLEVLMVQNNTSFAWDEQFIDLLVEKLSVDNFICLYLTFDGMRVRPFGLSGLWSSLKNKFNNCFLQEKHHFVYGNNTFGKWIDLIQCKSEIIKQRNV